MIQLTPEPANHPVTQQEISFPAMGSRAHLIGIGDAVSWLRARSRIDELESRWSRFRAGSEISLVNSRDGLATVVSGDTSLLIRRSVAAWRRTGGLFDPTVLRALITTGYDRDLRAIGHPRGSLGHDPAPGCSDIAVDPLTGVVFLPHGVGLDPGGIGKGLAADLVATEAVAGGAGGMLVSIGGDLRVAGSPPAQGWEIEIDHHVGPPARINLRAGGLATSSVLRRRWETTDGPAHHVIDPRTGAPSGGSTAAVGAVAVSVVAGEAWWAEALATTVLVGHNRNASGNTDDSTGGSTGRGTAAELEDMLGPAAALVTLADGHQFTLGGASGAFSCEPSEAA